MVNVRLVTYLEIVDGRCCCLCYHKNKFKLENIHQSSDMLSACINGISLSIGAHPLPSKGKVSLKCFL